MSIRTMIDEQKDAAKVLITSVGPKSRTIRCQHGYAPKSFLREYNSVTFEVSDAQIREIESEIGAYAIACDF